MCTTETSFNLLCILNKILVQTLKLLVIPIGCQTHIVGYKF